MKRTNTIVAIIVIATILIGVHIPSLVEENEPTPTYVFEDTSPQEQIEPPTFVATTELNDIQVDPYDVELIARTIWGEAEGVRSKTEQAAVAWCILNRVDHYGKTVEEVVTAPQQFLGYRAIGECPQEFYDLAADVLRRYEAEKQGETNSGRVLPSNYLYFTGDGVRNHFTVEWQSDDSYRWIMPSPYTT